MVRINLFRAFLKVKENDMKTFEGLGLHRVLNASLTYMKYETPTPIQAKAIPLALQGRDILGSAQTGTGKTAAFAIPLIDALLRDERQMALVMTPTRELGKQVMDIMRQLLGPRGKVKSAFLIGGEPISKQCRQLQNRPRLIVGTPGRINDHVERGTLELDQIKFLVLDEMDRMLDMGFSIQIDKIIKHMPKDRQTLMFSATMPNNIMKMADKYLDNPERVSVGSTNNPSKNIEQKIIKLPQDKKYGVLREELNERGGSIIVFVKTKRNADRLAQKLSDEDFKAEAIHGDLQQRKRERVIAAYRDKKFRILVATDVVARGLDVPHVEHVINYDMPQMPEDYIHRIGRTARAGAKGQALNLVAPQDGSKWSAIERLMDPNAKSESNDNDGFKSGGKKKSGGFGKKRSRGSSDKQRSGDFKGKRDFADKRKSSGDRRDDRPSFDKRSGEGKPFKKKKFDAPKGERDERAPRKDRSYGKDASFSDSQSFKKRKFDDRKGGRDDRAPRKERSFEQGGEGQKPAHKKVTKRSAEFAKGKGKPSGDFKSRKAKPNTQGKRHDGSQPLKRKRNNKRAA